jgi:hypothetical protein
VLARLRNCCALRYPVIKCLARAIIAWSKSGILSHTLLFLRFHMLHTITQKKL